MFGRRKRDFLKDSVAQRRAIEDERPWFLEADDEPELDIEAGRSAAMERPPVSDQPVVRPRSDPGAA